MDFSQINLQYLIHAQDLARQDPRRAGVLLELPEDQVELLCSLTPDQLARFALIRSPLLIPRESAGGGPGSWQPQVTAVRRRSTRSWSMARPERDRGERS